MAKKYSITALEGKFLLEVPEGFPLLYTAENKWVSFQSVAKLRGIMADRNGIIIFDGKRVRVSKIMLFTPNWAHLSYYHPMNKIERIDCTVM